VKNKIILITGASQGIGQAVANEFLQRGHIVYGTSRKWKENADTGFNNLDMDIVDPKSVEVGIKAIIEKEGRLDVLINNAGISHTGSIEDISTDIARSVFETNYIGTVNTIKAALPLMRKQGGGDIVNIGSLAGKIGVPFQAHYSASKYAIEGLSEALAHEVRKFGIRILLIEPGDVGTEIWENTDKAIAPDSVYKNALDRYFAVKENEMGTNADPPENVARKIADIVLSDTKTLRHPVAKGAVFMMIARKLLPDFIFIPLVARNYKI
jgi:NAD(P)-dependent dehydrogenase (short-subunit alcohol dehydrogenase family)